MQISTGNSSDCRYCFLAEAATATAAEADAATATATAAEAVAAAFKISVAHKMLAYFRAVAVFSYSFYFGRYKFEFLWMEFN